MLRKLFSGEEVLELFDSVRPAGIALIVDDHRDFVESTRTLLAQRGYAVVVARSGGEAIERVLADSIDAVVLDMKLPVLSGLGVYLELKKHGRTLPTIIGTGYTTEEIDNIESLRSISVTRTLVKRFEPQAILEPIEDMI